MSRASHLRTRAVSVQAGALSKDVHCAGTDAEWKALHAYRQQVLEYKRINEEAKKAWLGDKTAITSLGWLTRAGTTIPPDVLAYAERTRQELIADGIVTPAALLPDLVRSAIGHEKFNGGTAWGRVSAYLADSAMQHLLIQAGAPASESLGWFANEAREWAADRDVGLRNFAYRVRLAVAQMNSEPRANERWGTLPTMSRDQIADLLREGLNAYVLDHSQGEDASVLLPRLHAAEYSTYAHFFGSTEQGRLRLTMPIGAVETIVRASGRSCAEYEVAVAGRILPTDQLYARVIAAIAADDQAEKARAQTIAARPSGPGSRVSMGRRVTQQPGGRDRAAPATRA